MGKLEERALQEDAGYRQRRNVQREAAKAGTDYDYNSAIKAGLFAPKGAHWPSRIPTGPNAGLLLKSPKHPTFGKTVYSERRLGYKIYRKDGRLYSKKK